MTVSLGRVADRERKHPGGEASGHWVASGKKASGVIGIRAPGRIGKGGIRAKSRPGVPGPIHYSRLAGFRAWSHRGPWAWPVG